ncbi:MAG: hypothetical protein RL707_1396 [Pseudomonadota bacterium]
MTTRRALLTLGMRAALVSAGMWRASRVQAEPNRDSLQPQLSAVFSSASPIGALRCTTPVCGPTHHLLPKIGPNKCWCLSCAICATSKAQTLRNGPSTKCTANAR